MDKAACFNLGHVAKLHGFKGEVSLFFDTTHLQDYKSLESVYIEIDGVLIPFFISKIALNSNGFAKVRFEGVDSEDEARKLLRKQLYLPLSFLPKLSGTNFYDFEIIDFVVVDQEHGEIGNVVQVIDYPMNPLIQVHNAKHDKEVLLPLNNDLVQSVDRELKKIYVQTAKGLINIYLGDDF